ncbi:MAG TPA: acyltransferase [Solirubrobacteraceae bacterium]
MTRRAGSDGGARRVAALDGVRAIAALSVVAYHAWLYTLPQVSAGHRDSLGDLVLHELRLGLVLFFVLSGFLLYRPWARGEPPAIGSYALRRAARIVPAYWLALAGSVLLLWQYDAVPGVRLPPADDLWLFAVFGQNFTEATVLKLNAPMWTLAVEASFYVLLPVLGWLALRAGRRGIVVVPVVFGVLGVLYNRALADDAEVALTLTKILPAVAPYFALGMLAATPRRVPFVPLVLAGIALVVADGVWAADAATRGSHDIALRIWRDVPAAAGFALVLAAVAARPPRLLAAGPLPWLGKVSYGIYLWHVPLLLFLRAQGLLPLSPLGALVAVIGPTLVCASASWYLVERPLQLRARQAVRRRRAYLPVPA